MNSPSENPAYYPEAVDSISHLLRDAPYASNSKTAQEIEVLHHDLPGLTFLAKDRCEVFFGLVNMDDSITQKQALLDSLMHFPSMIKSLKKGNLRQAMEYKRKLIDLNLNKQILLYEDYRLAIEALLRSARGNQQLQEEYDEFVQRNFSDLPVPASSARNELIPDPEDSIDHAVEIPSGDNSSGLTVSGIYSQVGRPKRRTMEVSREENFSRFLLEKLRKKKYPELFCFLRNLLRSASLKSANLEGVIEKSPEFRAKMKVLYSKVEDDLEWLANYKEDLEVLAEVVDRIEEYEGAGFDDLAVSH